MTKGGREGPLDRPMAESQLSELQNMRVLLEEARGLSRDLAYHQRARLESSIGEALERFSYRVCPWHRIPAMREVAACVLGTDRQKRLFGGLKQRLKRPGLGLPQQGLNLREGLLYGVEVGGVGRQQPQLAALLLDQFPDPFALVHGEVVHEDDLPGLEGRSQDLPHVDAEGVGVR